MNDQKILVITGPTASGKTTLGVACARAFDGEIVSADSRQLYRGMDLGTGKDLEEYGDVPYHMIDIVPAGYHYNLFEYLRDARAAIAGISGRGRMPVIVGGTGLYVESLLNGFYLPEVPVNAPLRASLQDKSLEELTAILSSMKKLHNTTDVDTAKRAIRAIEIATYYHDHPEEAAGTKPQPIDNAVIVGVDIPRDERRKRISHRLKARIDAGMIDEVKSLIASGVHPDDLIYYGLEYKYLTEFVIGRINYCEMIVQLEIAIHQFAKRQMTWFRGMERRGHHIHWIPYDTPADEFVNMVNDLL